MVKIFWTSGTGRVLENDFEPAGWMNDMAVGETMELKNSRFIKRPDGNLDVQMFQPPTFG